MSSWARRAACAVVLALGCWPRPAAAKVVFTGYGSFLFDADANIRVYAPASLLGAVPQGTQRARGFSADAVGLFAATSLGPDTDFLMDLSYRSIGSSVKETLIQYAFLDQRLPWDVDLKAGKVTLPFGYYNTRRFYPFQRVSLTAPLFQSAILGLPIADVGAVASRRFPLGPVDLDVRLFGVNGYGSTPSSSTTFRSASLPGGLSISNNLSGSNNNRDIAVGGQLALSRGPGAEWGASYYRGAWDKSGERLFQMVGTHVHWTPGGWDFL
ncbi:MAG: hypothetical protein KGL53_13520, partial [Elusimicrobia bacterium]|nr:hypothetical protein [Elusimicrobiota bacterium]